ncbi:MAG: hypothetical protein ACT6QU_14695 [Aliihoeflea sp.]|uniref:hypothetical protein n=1 Tax=Aliihoeflea sp. TaxID=2608088 RepID=UPI0040343A68
MTENARTPRAILSLHVAGHLVDPDDLKASIVTLLMAYDEVGIALEDMDARIHRLPPPAERVVETLLEYDGMLVHDTVSRDAATLLDDFMHRRAMSLVVRTPAGEHE